MATLRSRGRIGGSAENSAQNVGRRRTLAGEEAGKSEENARPADGGGHMKAAF
jgi:hypothetical protein